MAADPQVQPSTTAAERPAEPTKKTPKNRNPLKWFGAMSIRVQVIILALIVVLVMVSIESLKKKPRSQTQASKQPVAQYAPSSDKPATSVAPVAAPHAGAGAAPGIEGLEERFPEVTPTAAVMANLSKKEPKALENLKELERGVPDAILAEAGTGPRESGDALANAGDQNGTRTIASGMPYAPPGKRATISEVMGVFGPPPTGDTPRAGAQETGQSHGTPSPSSSSFGSPSASGSQPTPGELAVFAPFGRLVKCKLVTTLDSLVPENCPIIAMVVQDVDWNGHVIIPVTTEVYGYVNGKPKVDANGVGRLFDTGQWTLVLPRQPGGKNGREWNVKGRAMDRRETLVNDDGSARAWGIDDGSPGMIGYTISTLDNEVIKQFVASFIASAATAAANVGQTQQAAAGEAGALGATVPQPTASNAAVSAAGAGTGAAFNAIADRINTELKDRGFYVRVPAGKEFYLFVEQTLDPSQAKVGLHREIVNAAQQQK
jgi:hypothetical protein